MSHWLRGEISQGARAVLAWLFARARRGIGPGVGKLSLTQLGLQGDAGMLPWLTNELRQELEANFATVVYGGIQTAGARAR